MKDIAILQAGAAMRAQMLENYHSIGLARGDQLARQYVYDLGCAVKSARGVNEAAAILYAAADAISADIPIEEFHLPPMARAQNPADGAGAEPRPGFIRRQRDWLNLHSGALVAGIWIGIILGGFAR